MLATNVATAKCSSDTRARVTQKVVTDIGILSTTASFKSNTNGRKTMIVLNPDDQMSLQRAGGMTDKGAKRLDHLFVQLTRLSICSNRTTPEALTDGNMSEFKVMKVAVSIKNQIRERRMFIVASVVSCICTRLQKSLNTELFVPSSVNTKLGDDVVIVRISGDKGGKEMQFKFGFAVINQALANSPEFFDLCAKLDAVDTYHKLKAAIFNDKTGWETKMSLMSVYLFH